MKFLSAGSLCGLLFLAGLMYLCGPCAMAESGEKPVFESTHLFPPVDEHVHGSTIVELKNGDLLVAWFQGEGERQAEKVAIMGARLEKGSESWSQPFLLADTPGLPDINPVLFVDSREQLWLFYYTVIAHQWDTSLLMFRVSQEYLSGDAAPVWAWQEVLHVKPGDTSIQGIQPGDRFVESVSEKLLEYRAYLVSQGAGEELLAGWDDWEESVRRKASGRDMIRTGAVLENSGERTVQQMGYPYYRRMGWQTRNKPIELKNGRMILPLYSDGFDFSLMAITDDRGRTWSFSDPLVGAGNIQPTILETTEGKLYAYMRDNGPAPKRLHVSYSEDGGDSWSYVRDSELPNSGAGADGVRLANGHWLIANNDSESGRRSLAISISIDEGKSWAITRHVERDYREEAVASRSHYPAIIQSKDGMIHLVYSFHMRDSKPGKTIKYARFNEAWVQARD